MIYLIGVDHIAAQRRRRGEDLTDCQLQFRSIVESAIQSIGPALLAEEDHPDFLYGPDIPSDKIADSILLEIAKAHGIEDRHRFVDPNLPEREEIGYQQHNGSEYDEIPNRACQIVREFPKRERFWLSKLQDSLDCDILFVCGSAHIESFCGLLAERGINYAIWADQIGVSPSDLELDAKVRQYIKDHKEWLEGPSHSCMRESPAQAQ